jgi:hypothetical protein
MRGPGYRYPESLRDYIIKSQAFGECDMLAMLAGVNIGYMVLNQRLKG